MSSAVPKRHYWAVHKWMVYHHGRPTVCEGCNATDKTIDWANISGKYFYERNDFKALCRRCHRLFDKGSTCKYGHPLMGDNLYDNETTRKRGVRICRLCARSRTKNHESRSKITLGVFQKEYNLHG